MSACRKYGERESRPIPVWNGLLEHCRRIGSAIWVFLWCIDRVTRESDGKGLVLGDSPIKVERIAADLHLNERSIRRDLKRLAGRYLEISRTPYGLRIRVLNSQKFNIWRSGENVRTETERSDKSAGQIGRKCPERSGENVRSYKEDSAVDTAEDKDTKQARLLPRPVLLPTWIPVQPWKDFLEMRSKLRKPVTTQRAVELLIARLGKLRELGDDPRSVLEQSIENSWQGIFPLRREGRRNGASSGTLSNFASA